MNQHSRLRALSWPMFAVLLVSSVGCTKTELTRIARFNLGHSPQPVQRVAPTTGAYRVKYANVSSRELHTLGGTQRIVGRGGVLGFTTSEDGKVVALACTEQIPLDRLPDSARYCVWVAKEEKPTQFTREVGKAVDTAVSVTVTGAAVTALVAGEVALNALDDDDCDDGEAPRHGHHHHHHGGRADRSAGAEQNGPEDGGEDAD